jgi:hypothetical protein
MAKDISFPSYVVRNVVSGEIVPDTAHGLPNQTARLIAQMETIVATERISETAFSTPEACADAIERCEFEVIYNATGKG